GGLRGGERCGGGDGDPCFADCGAPEAARSDLNYQRSVIISGLCFLIMSSIGERSPSFALLIARTRSIGVSILMLSARRITSPPWSPAFLAGESSATRVTNTPSALRPSTSAR